MKIFKYRHFNRWARDQSIADDDLKAAALAVETGLYDANLGGGLYKKRVARKNQGKRGGYRTLLAFRSERRVIFFYGFAKNERANINFTEEKVFKRLAKTYLAASDKEIQHLLFNKELIEVT